MSSFKAMTFIIVRKVKTTTCDPAVIPHSHNQIPTNYPSVPLSDPCLQCEISFFSRLTEDMNHAHMSSTQCARMAVGELSKEQSSSVLPGFCGSVTSPVAGRFGL